MREKTVQNVWQFTKKPYLCTRNATNKGVALVLIYAHG